MSTNQATSNKRRNFEWYIWVLFGVLVALILLGVVIVGIRQWSGNAPVAIFWCLAWGAVGYLVGFLFGLPRVVQGDAAPAPRATSPEAAKNGSPIQQAAYRQFVNQNIAEISDWLTKIFVGLGLVELQRVPGYLDRAGAFMARSFDPGFHPFAVAIIIYFSIVGFFCGYLGTRIYLSLLFRMADVIAGSDRAAGEFLGLSKEQEKTLSDDLPGLEPEERKLKNVTQTVARQVVNTSFEQLKTADENAIWAKAQYALGNYDEAIKAYQRAVELSPDDAKVRFEYAVTLDAAKRPASVVREQLLTAYKLIKPETPPEIKKQIYKSLIYQSLYMPAPQGFEEAIKYGEEYIRAPENLESGGIWVNLAAAYGQKYRFAEAHTNYLKPEESLDKIKAKALNAVRQAIRIDSRWKARLEMLLRHDYPEKDPRENDLEVFESDEDFRQALGLRPKQ